MAWKKGQSGNPGGRPAVVKKVRALAQQHSEEGIEALVAIGRDRNEKGAVRVAAWKEVLDRGLGKAVQGVEVTGADGAPVRMSLEKLSEADLEKAREIALKALPDD